MGPRTLFCGQGIALSPATASLRTKMSNGNGWLDQPKGFFDRCPVCHWSGDLRGRPNAPLHNRDMQAVHDWGVGNRLMRLDCRKCRVERARATSGWLSHMATLDSRTKIPTLNRNHYGILPLASKTSYFNGLRAQFVSRGYAFEQRVQTRYSRSLEGSQAPCIAASISLLSSAWSATSIRSVKADVRRPRIGAVRP
jgi:hypothetical protein